MILTKGFDCFGGSFAPTDCSFGGKYSASPRSS
jgi:hypothetical protein